MLTFPPVSAMAFPDPIILNGNSFVRIMDGHYRFDGSTVDQPADLIVKSDMKGDGISSFVIERCYSVNQLDAPDAKLRVYTVVRGDLGIFDATQVQSFVNDINLFVADTTNIARIYRGEK